MKKLIVLLLSFLFFIAPVFADSELYNLRNTNRANVVGIINSILVDKNYTIQKRDPFLAQKNNIPIIIITRQNGNDVYLYIESGKSFKSVRKGILKYYSYEEIPDRNYLDIFHNSAQKVLTGESKVYNFEEPKRIQTAQPIFSDNETKAAAKPKNVNPNSMAGYIGKIGKGVKLKAYLQNPINTASVSKNDKVIAVLEQNWSTQGGYTIAEQGSVFDGYMTYAQPARAGLRNAKVSFVFSKLSTPSGQIYPISTKSIDFVVDNDGRFVKITKQVITNAAIGAAAGAAIGAISLLFGGDSNAIWKGAAIGAGISGVSSTIGAVAERGIDVEIPAYTEIEIELEQDIDVILNY